MHPLVLVVQSISVIRLQRSLKNINLHLQSSETEWVTCKLAKSTQCESNWMSTMYCFYRICKGPSTYDVRFFEAFFLSTYLPLSGYVRALGPYPTYTVSKDLLKRLMILMFVTHLLKIVKKNELQLCRQQFGVFVQSMSKIY